MTVSANLSTTMQSITSGKSVSEQTTVIDDVKVSSEVNLFALEYTEPYYFKKEKKWYCVAYINRADAWRQCQPQIDGAKNKSQSIISDEDKQNPKSTGSDRIFGEFKLSFSYKAIVISIMVYSGIIGIIGLVIAGVTLKISSPKSILIATFAMLFLIFVMISFVISARTVKPFVKIEFLKSLIENISGNNDLIKKYCDTLVEL